MDINTAIMHPLAPYFLVMGIFLLIGLITYFAIYISKREEKKRTEELKEMALRSGFSYSENVDININDLYIFGEHGGKAWNMLKTERQNVFWRIFDYWYGVGKSAQLQTVFIAETTGSFPKFVLMKETFLSKLDSLVGRYHDIEFDNHEQFSKQYILSGDDEISIRNIFNQNVLRHFENCKSDGTIAANMNWIAFYQLGERLKPEELRSKFDEVTALLSVFLR